MENKLSCAVVRDLLPSYAEGLTSDETNRSIEEHIGGCEGCAEALRRMKEPEPSPPAPEVDFLKKVRRRSTRASLVIGIALALCSMGILMFRVFYVGSGSDSYGTVREVSVKGDTVTICGTLANSGTAAARVTFSDSNGMVQAHVYTAPKAFFNSGDFTASHTAASPITQVRMGSLIVWEEGTRIGPVASELFAASNPFVGDMTANANIAAILGVGDQFGPFTNELQTASEPYGWTLILENTIASGDEVAAQDIMTADSCAMLAVIENLGSVTWRYQAEGGAQREYTLSAADASRFAGQDIKLCGKSASALQALMQSLSIKWSGMRDVFNTDWKFRLAIRNSSTAAIYGFDMDYYLDGKPIGSSATVNADGSALSNGSETVFEFLPKDFPEGTTAIALSGFSFDLYVLDKDGNRSSLVKKAKISAKYSWTFPYTLSGGWDSFVFNRKLRERGYFPAFPFFMPRRI